MSNDYRLIHEEVRAGKRCRMVNCPNEARVKRLREALVAYRSVYKTRRLAALADAALAAEEEQ